MLRRCFTCVSHVKSHPVFIHVSSGGLDGGGDEQTAGAVRALRGGAGEEAGPSQGRPTEMGAAQNQTGRGPRWENDAAWFFVFY